MNNSKSSIRLIPFDAKRYLIDESAIAAYINEVIEMENKELLRAALDDVARIQGLPLATKDATSGQ